MSRFRRIPGLMSGLLDVTLPAPARELALLARGVRGAATAASQPCRAALAATAPALAPLSSGDSRADPWAYQGGRLDTDLVSRGSAALKSAQVALRKRFGQHLLKNPDVVRNIVDCAGIQPGEAVFEIGPGTGNMTVHLLDTPARVLYAVELDRDLYRIVNNRVARMGPEYLARFQCVNADFLSVPLPHFDVLVANIPYQISSPVLRRLFTHRPLPSRAVIMFQLEFAERMVAKPGTSQYCRLAVNTQLLSHSARLIMKIRKNQFRPPPKVDSAVIEVFPKPPPSDLDFEDWDGFLRLAFSGKNKMLRSVFDNKTYLAALAALRLPGHLVLPTSAAPSSSPKADEAEAEAAVVDVLEEGAAETADETVEEEDGDAAALASFAAVAAETQSRRAANKADPAILAATRADICAALDECGVARMRANGLTIPAFLDTYRALRARGFRFVPPTAPRQYAHTPDVEGAATQGEGAPASAAAESLPPSLSSFNAVRRYEETAFAGGDAADASGREAAWAAQASAGREKLGIPPEAAQSAPTVQQRNFTSAPVVPPQASGVLAGRLVGPGNQAWRVGGYVDLPPMKKPVAKVKAGAGAVSASSSNGPRRLGSGPSVASGKPVAAANSKAAPAPSPSASKPSPRRK